MPRSSPTLQLPYPYNLLADVFAQDISTLRPTLPSDVAVAVEYVLSRLPDREREMMRCRFMERMTLQAIGEAFGLTTERVRQILSEVRFKLRHPSRSSILKNGIAGTIELAKQQGYDAGYVKGCEDGFAKGFAAAKAELAGEKHYERPSDAWPIEDLDLSVRAYNCLIRAHIRTVQQISVMTYDDLYRIRNMGLKSLTEIVQKMAALGYDTSAMEKPGN